MFDPITLFAALAPVAVDAGKALIQKFIVPDQYKPANIDEYTKMKDVDLQLFKAMNEVGTAAPSYPWVEAIVRLQRPFVAAVVLGAWSCVTLGLVAVGDVAAVNNFAAAIGFYLFGDRTLFYISKKK